MDWDGKTIVDFSPLKNKHIVIPTLCPRTEQMQEPPILQSFGNPIQSREDSLFCCLFFSFLMFLYVLYFVGRPISFVLRRVGGHSCFFFQPPHNKVGLAALSLRIETALCFGCRSAGVSGFCSIFKVPSLCLVHPLFFLVPLRYYNTHSSRRDSFRCCSSLGSVVGLLGVSMARFSGRRRPLGSCQTN